MRKIFKKIFTISVLASIGAVSFSLAGCNNESDKDQNAELATESTMSGEEIDALFNIGKTEDNIYTNDFFGIKYTGTDDWRLLNEEQLATISSSIKDVLTNEDAKAALDEGKTSIIMYAVARDKAKNASLTVEKHEINNTQDADMDAFLDKSVASLTENLPDQGFSDLEVTKTEVTFCGEPAKAIKLKAKYNVKDAADSSKTEEKDIYETMIYLFRGSYSGCVTATSFNEDNTGEVLKMFSKAQ